MTPRTTSPGQARPKAPATDFRHLKDLPLLHEMTRLLNDPFVILNCHREIIFCNQALTDLLEISGPEEIRGLRPEAAGKLSQTANRIFMGGEGHAFDFQVRDPDLSLMDRHFCLVILNSISAEKRRSIKERIFFHDILNTAGGIHGLVRLMAEATPEEMDEFLSLAASSTKTLVEEINAQRDLMAAEAGELALEMRDINARELMARVAAIYKSHPACESKRLAVHPDTAASSLFSDPRVLTRILGNMVKNALEAEGPGALVTMGADCRGTEIELWVENASVMPEEVRLQIFQRSFTTKGAGRGFGTYAMKLLGETCLNGRVSFQSKKTSGTRFSIALPLGIRQPGPDHPGPDGPDEVGQHQDNHQPENHPD